MKHLDFYGFPKLFRALLATGGLVPSPVGAAVYKCLGKDGKAAFSDQPCSAGQTTTAVREPAGALGPKPEDAKDPKDLSEAARASARDRLRDSRTPECAELAGRITRFGQTGGRLRPMPK